MSLIIFHRSLDIWKYLDGPSTFISSSLNLNFNLLNVEMRKKKWLVLQAQSLKYFAQIDLGIIDSIFKCVNRGRTPFVWEQLQQRTNLYNEDYLTYKFTLEFGWWSRLHWPLNAVWVSPMFCIKSTFSHIWLELLDIKDISL